MAITAEQYRAYMANPTDPKFQGASGTDAWRTSVSGGQLRTSFVDENDFNRYYGLDYDGNMWANPNGTYGKYGPAGGSGAEDAAAMIPEYFNAPKWDGGLLAPAITPPAAPAAPEAPAAPPSPAAPPPVPPPAAPPPAAQDRSVATYTPPEAQAGKATGYGYSATSWDAYLREVGMDELSRHQLGIMLDENGDYVRRAQTRGMQTAQARGLLNSSLAAGAAHAAAIDAAQPFALQDASTYAKQALANQDMENKERSENAQAINRAAEVTASNKTQASVVNANNSTQISITNTQLKSAALQAEATAKNDQAMQVLKGEQAETLARIDADAKAQVQRTASTAAIVAQGSQNITTILATKDLSAAQQQAGVDKQTTLMDYSLKLVNGSSNLDLPKLY